MTWISRAALLFAFMTGMVGCAAHPPPGFRSLLESQPYALQLLPAPFPPLSSIDQMEILFSEPIRKETVKPETIFVVNGEIDEDNPPEIDDVEADIRDGALKIIPGSFPETDPRKVIWRPETPIHRGALTLVITPKLLGENNIPFNQKPGKSPTPLFVVFRLALDAGGSSNDSASSGGSPSQSPSIPKNRPSSLTIHEIFYDSVASDTDGSAFVELYGTPGADVDNYQITLVNGADGNILEAVTFPEGSKIGEDGIFLIADAKTNQPDATGLPDSDLIDNFDPQNGPDGIQLLDDRGTLLDTVVYGEGGIETAQNGLALGEGGPATDVAAGHSLSRTDGIDTDDNLADFKDLAAPTPGVL